MFAFFFTGTPLLVQLYIFYDGVGSMDWVQNLMEVPGFGFLREGYFWVLLGLVFNTAAYTTIILSGAIRNTENGEVEAGRAYGMNPSQVMRHIILPSSLRRALPAYSNEVILMVQATALASSFTLYEITGQAHRFDSTNYQPFIAYVPAAVLYLVITFVLVQVFKVLERKYLAHLKPRAH
jgi:arginine/ornithine transport system permease protein